MNIGIQTDDFNFRAEYGSDGARLTQLGPNHFRIVPGHAPGHPLWPNAVQFRIERNARGNPLRLDLLFDGGKGSKTDEYFLSYTYDHETWHPVDWLEERNGMANTVRFPPFTEDQVTVGHQLPMSHERATALLQCWARHPHATLHRIGSSVEGRGIFRLTVADPDGAPPARRWVHHLANQHPGEGCAQWRIAGAVDWILSDEAAAARKSHVFHFILLNCPDACAHGFRRCNVQGVDMNRDYLPEGADMARQSPEIFAAQRDLETLMASDAPVTDAWSMHTWPGKVEPILCGAGPEFGSETGSVEELRECLVRHDEAGLIKPLSVRGNPLDPEKAICWSGGPHHQFGVTLFLCEGGGALMTKAENLASGRSIAKALVAFYRQRP